MTDTDKIKAVRAAMPVTTSKVYFNTGAVGPISTITTEILKQSNHLDVTEGRATQESVKLNKQTKAELRQAIANLVRADRATIALTHHTTDGMNIVTHGLTWQPGDEIITTNLEHPAGLLPPYVLRQRFGVVVKVIEITPGDTPDEIVARFEAAITPRTRLMAYSHVAWNLGSRLPLADIVAMGHRHSVLSLVDGAQSAGSIPLDLPASGVDFYALPGQKWLCGPTGVGALYVRPDRMSILSPTFVGYGTIAATGVYDYAGYYMPTNDASRFEVATVYGPALRAMVANMAWFEETLGWEWVYGRIAHLADYARRGLSEVKGITVITPPGPQAGLVSFALDGYDPARVMTKLAQDNIILRYIDHPYCLRISTGIYNTEGDIDQLITALKAILRLDPATLPEYVKN
jgi:L-cysteine/cystine lyase